MSVIDEVKRRRKKKVRKTYESSYGDVLKSGYEFIEAMRRGEKRQFSTGFSIFDNHLNGGIFYKNNIVIGGASGSGKSMFGTTMLLNFYDFNPGLKIKTLYWNFEMPDFAQGLRIICRLTRRPFSELFVDGMGFSFETLMSNLEDKHIHFYNSPSSVEFILDVNEQMIEEFPDYQIVNFVDHTRLVLDDDNENLMMKNLMGGLNALRNKASVTNIILSQFSKENMKQNKKTNVYVKPSSSDLFGNQLVENFADYILLLHKPDKFYKRGFLIEDDIKYDIKDVLFLELDKARFSSTGTFLYKARFDINQFEEMSDLEIIG